MGSLTEELGQVFDKHMKEYLSQVEPFVDRIELSLVTGVVSKMGRSSDVQYGCDYLTVKKISVLESGSDEKEMMKVKQKISSLFVKVPDTLRGFCFAPKYVISISGSQIPVTHLILADKDKCAALYLDSGSYSKTFSLEDRVNIYDLFE